MYKPDWPWPYHAIVIMMIVSGFAGLFQMWRLEDKPEESEDIMCLDTITKTGLNRSGIGWKVFKIAPRGGLHSQVFQKSYSRPRNQWLTAKRKKVRIWRGHYFTGFHIFLYKSAAIRWGYSKNATKVKYRKGHTLGNQEGRVIVADEMLILPEKHKKGAKP